MDILTLSDIKKNISFDDIVNCVENSLIEQSNQSIDQLDKVDMIDNRYIKYGHTKNKSYFIMEIDSGNLFSQRKLKQDKTSFIFVISTCTGKPVAIIQDNGWISHIRAAIVSMLAHKHLLPSKLEQIGIMGSGTQARQQLLCLPYITSCKQISIWSRSLESGEKFIQEMSSAGFKVSLASNPEEVVKNSQLIVTTTPSQQPIIHNEWVQPGTHITAVGASGAGKQELDVELLFSANQLVIDNKDNIFKCGEISQAYKSGFIDNHPIELGELMEKPTTFQRGVDDITVFDLTGEASSEFEIAAMIYNSYINN
ncbi:hypothetical protein [Spartinivicinus poritis]|nr:hypothetical protein [Spartinivicinus sp. A2-2]